MALVSYGSGSDDSGSEDEDEQHKMQVDVNDGGKVAASKTAQHSSASTSVTNELDVNIASSTAPGLKLDAVLPKPKYSTKLLEIDPVPPKKVYGDEESMPKPPGPSSLGSSFSKLQKVGAKVRISIPSLKDFENDEKDEKDRKKIYQPPKKGSGLFAILPEPKLGSYMPKAQTNAEFAPAKNNFANSTSTASSSSAKSSAPLIPQQTLKRPLSPTAASKKLAQVRAKYMKQEIDCIKVVRKKGKDKVEESEAVKPRQRVDSDEDEESNSDFFSLDSSAQDNDDVVPMETDRVPSPVFFSADRYDQPAEALEEERLPSASFTDQSPQLEDDVMKYIQPSKKARRGGTTAPVNIIDINADDLRPQSTEWLKAISDTSMIPPRKVNLPGGLSKRKHQITYLAAEAKAREEELQNQWAANRHARRQTQNKYGF